MKLTSKEYADLLRRNPALKPDAIIKTANTHKDLHGLPHSPWTDEPIPYAQEMLVKQALKVHPDWLHAPYKKEFLIAPGAYSVDTSPPTLKFTIPGQPVGSPRQTQRDKWMKRPCVVKYRDWCSKARASVPKGTDLGVYREVIFIAYLEFPKSYSTTKRAWLTNQPHLLKPDIDNLEKSLLDALFEQDCVIWRVTKEKRWQDSKGARIEVKLS